MSLPSDIPELATPSETAAEDPGPAAEQAQGLATTVTKQTETLYGEVARFLSTTKGA